MICAQFALTTRPEARTKPPLVGKYDGGISTEDELIRLVVLKFQPFKRFPSKSRDLHPSVLLFALAAADPIHFISHQFRQSRNVSVVYPFDPDPSVGPITRGT
jgi:hypothetical protein